MPISFNETVPTITDILENANILNNQITELIVIICIIVKKELYY